MEEASEDNTGKLPSIGNSAKKRRSKAKNAGDMTMDYWNTVGLQRQSDYLVFRANGMVHRHAHWRGQPDGLGGGQSLRLPRLRSTTLPLYPATSLVDRSLHGYRRSVTDTVAPPSTSSLYGTVGNGTLPHGPAAGNGHKMSLTYEEHELRRRIEEEKRKQRQLQR